VTASDGSAGRLPSGAVDDRALARSSRTMALGTLTSRATGFLRTAVVAAAIGLSVGDPYNVANTIPNTVHDLLLGGILTSVVVPLLVQAARRDDDGGQAYTQRLFTLVVLVLGAATVLATVGSPVLGPLYGGSFGPAKQHLTVTFAYFFLPQIFFYGISALLQAILNTRGHFAAPMWAPVLNNVVIIATGGVFIAITAGHPLAGQLSGTQILILGVGTTLGIVAQAAALVPALRSVGFSWRPRFDFAGSGLGHAARLAGWMFGYVVTNQLGYLAIVRLAEAAGRSAGGSAYSPYFYAYTLFSLPYAVISVSVITALLPRMSDRAAARQLPAVSADLARGMRLSGVLLVPAALGGLALGPLVATVVFAHGNITLEQARLIGAALAAFAVGLVPFAAVQLQLRAFYAANDTRTPALVNVGRTVLNIAADVALYFALPPHDRVVGLAAGFTLSYAVNAAVLAVILRRRLLDPRRRHVARTHARLALAGAAGAAVAYGVAHGVTGGLGLSFGPALLAVAVGTGAGAPVYIWLALRMRIPEVRQIAVFFRRGDEGRPAL
jgi:putative peptidoglycan lipid II flippase